MRRWLYAALQVRCNRVTFLPWGNYELALIGDRLIHAALVQVRRGSVPTSGKLQKVGLYGGTLKELDATHETLGERESNRFLAGIGRYGRAHRVEFGKL